MGILGAEAKVLRLAIPYLRICMLGAVIAFPVYVINGMLRGTGEMRLPMLIVCSVIAINAILLPPLIFGLNLGLNGAALAYVIADGIGTLAGIWILVRGKSSIKIDLRIEKCRLITVKEIVRFVSFNGFELFAVSVIALVMMKLVGVFGTHALAAYGIGRRLLMMVSLLGFDLAMTTSIIVANNLGAKKIKRAELSTWMASGFNILIMGLAAAILFISAEQTIGIFDPNPEVIKIGANYLRITTPSWIFLAVWIILRRALIGARDVISPLIISLFTLGGVQISLAYWLPKSLGINGVWWAIFIANILQGLISSAWFYAGRWKLRNQ
jgi:putative MATE family efflux protein